MQLLAELAPRLGADELLGQPLGLDGLEGDGEEAARVGQARRRRPSTASTVPSRCAAQRYRPSRSYRCPPAVRLVRHEVLHRHPHRELDVLLPVRRPHLRGRGTRSARRRTVARSPRRSTFTPNFCRHQSASDLGPVGRGRGSARRRTRSTALTAASRLGDEVLGQLLAADLLQVLLGRASGRTGVHRPASARSTSSPSGPRPGSGSPRSAPG